MKNLLILTVLALSASCASHSEREEARCEGVRHNSPVILEQAQSPEQTPQERQSELFQKRTETSPRRP